MFLVLFDPMWAALVACKNTSSSEAVCLLPSTFCKVDTYRNVLCDKTKMAVGMMFLHAYSLHSTERENRVTSGVLRRLGNNLANHQKASPSSFTHCTLSWMISYLLLLNEHNKTLDFGLECPWHNYSILLPHTPVIFHTFFPMTVKKPTVLLTLHLVFTYTRKKNITLNMMPAEPGALIKYMRTQVCTFCQSGGGFPAGTRGWVSQNLNLKVQKIKWKKPNFNPKSIHFV